MGAGWLIEWDTDQEKPLPRFSQNEEMISFAHFPENAQSFVLFEGYLFDKHNFQANQNAADAYRVIEYYHRYKEDLFLKLRGGYSIIIWDQARDCLIVGRDPMGLVPFYYYWANKKLVLSSDQKALLDHPNIEVGFNRLLITEQIMGFYTDHQRTETYFESIQRLPPAHYMKLQQQHLLSYRYWDPIPSGFSWATEDEEKTLPDLFQQAVGRCLSAGADSISMSGGLDSVSLAVMAHEISQSKQLSPLHIISGKTPISGGDEGDIQIAVAEALNMPHTILELADVAAENTAIQKSLDLSYVSPIPSMNIFESFYIGLLEAGSAYGLSNILLGTGADELFFVYSVWARDLLAGFRLKKYFEYIQAMSAYMENIIPPQDQLSPWRQAFNTLFTIFAQSQLGRFASTIIRSLRSKPPTLPDWLNDSDQDLMKELQFRIENSTPVNRVAGESRFVQFKRQIPQSVYSIFFNEHRYFYTKYAGFTPLFPYYDLDLMNLAYRLRPEQLMNNGLVKAPLQQFLSENLPSNQLPAKKTNYAQVIHSALRANGKEAWLHAGGGAYLEKIGIINRNKLNAFLEEYFCAEHDLKSTVWQVLSIEAWLRAFLS